MNYRKMKN